MTTQIRTQRLAWTAHTHLEKRLQVGGVHATVQLVVIFIEEQAHCPQFRERDGVLRHHARCSYGIHQAPTRTPETEFSGLLPRHGGLFTAAPTHAHVHWIMRDRDQVRSVQNGLTFEGVQDGEWRAGVEERCIVCNLNGTGRTYLSTKGTVSGACRQMFHIQ